MSNRRYHRPLGLLLCLFALAFSSSALALSIGSDELLVEPFDGPSAADWTLEGGWQAVNLPAGPASQITGDHLANEFNTGPFVGASFADFATYNNTLDATAHSRVNFSFHFQLSQAGVTPLSTDHALSFQYKVGAGAGGTWKTCWSINAAQAHAIGTADVVILTAPSDVPGNLFQVRLVASGPRNGETATWRVDNVYITANNLSSAGAIGPASILDGVEGSSYALQFTVDGNVMDDNSRDSWEVFGLPHNSGLSMASSTGTLSGTPAAGTAGVHSITVTYFNFVFGDWAQKDYLLVITAGGGASGGHYAISTYNILPGAVEGVAYSIFFEGGSVTPGYGTPPDTWSSPNLPAWLSLNPSTGELTGTPPAMSAGNVSFTVEVEDSTAFWSDSGTFDLTIHAAGTVLPITITTPNLPGATEGTAYSKQLRASGGTPPYTWTMQVGHTLPNGLSLSAAGVISGTPGAGSPGTGMYQFVCTDSLGDFSFRNLSLTVTPIGGALSIVTTTLPTATTGTAYNTTVVAAGGVAPYSFSHTVGTMPTGLSISSGGVISGTPATGTDGNYAITITVTDSVSAFDDRSYILTVAAPGTVPPPGTPGKKKAGGGGCSFTDHHQANWLLLFAAGTLFTILLRRRRA